MSDDRQSKEAEEATEAAAAETLERARAEAAAEGSDDSRVSETRPVVASLYSVAVIVPCDKKSGGCGANNTLTHADAMNNAAFGATFSVDCGRCGAKVLAKPHPGSAIATARGGNRHQRRARAAKGGLVVG